MFCFHYAYLNSNGYKIAIYMLPKLFPVQMTVKYSAHHHQLTNLRVQFDFMQDPCDTNKK